jgi:hypothetical protein
VRQTATASTVTLAERFGLGGALGIAALEGVAAEVAVKGRRS